MAQVYKILGQSNPSATTLTDAYTVPASTEAVISSIIICNRGATATTVRVSISTNGAADSNEQYIYYDLPMAANDTFIATVGITLGDTDKVRVYTNDAQVSFNILGSEIS